MKPLIRIEGLTKVYGNFTAVDNLNFDIKRNEIFGILGPNGAGKTTTINMICGLLPITRGKIDFDHNGKSGAGKMIGYCPQENIFYPKLTCLEQLVFTGNMFGIPSRILKPKAADLLDKLGLKEKSDVWASKLSGGMKRRLNICLALIHDPEILILDEPEAGLDPQSRILVREFIRNFGKEKTVILTTHNMDEADRLADRIAIIDMGKLLLVDTGEQLKRTIGDGDTLEMTFEDADPDTMQQMKKMLSEYQLILNWQESFMWIRDNNILEKLLLIKETAYELGLKITEFKLHKNTLEDVFIHLTGKNLRA